MEDHRWADGFNNQLDVLSPVILDSPGHMHIQLYMPIHMYNFVVMKSDQTCVYIFIYTYDSNNVQI